MKIFPPDQSFSKVQRQRELIVAIFLALSVVFFWHSTIFIGLVVPGAIFLIAAVVAFIEHMVFLNIENKNE